MKKQFLLFSIIFILINPWLKGQVNVDHPIVLTGNGANAKLTGIQNVTGAHDALSVQSMQNGSFIYAAASGSNNNFSITISPPINAYMAGMVFNFISNQTVTGPATLNVNNLGAIPITKYVNQYLMGCEIFTGQFVTVAYDGTNFQMTSVIFPGTFAGTPVATAGTSATPTQITANWDSAAHSTGYYLDAATDSGFLNAVDNFTKLYAGDVLSYNITGLSCGTTYYYRVRAADNCGQSNNSNVVSCSTPPFAGTPVATAGSGAMSTQVTANWNSAANATAYYLNVATDPGFVNFVPGYNNLNVGNDTTYNVTGLSCGTTYYYQVSAANACGQSNNSNVISYSTASCCNDGFQVDPNCSLSTDLVSYWRFEGNSTDFHGSNNGSDVSMAYGAQYGKVNQGAYFNGNSSYITLSNNPTSGSSNFSIFFWLKTTTSGTLLSFGSNNCGQGLYIYAYPSGVAHLDLSCDVGPSSALTVTDGNWHFIGVTNTGGTIQVYVDGTASGTSVAMSPNIAAGAAYIGRSIYNSTGFTGDMDELGIWSRALTSTEITTLYNGGAGQTMQ